MKNTMGADLSRFLIMTANLRAALKFCVSVIY